MLFIIKRLVKMFLEPDPLNAGLFFFFKQLIQGENSALDVLFYHEFFEVDFCALRTGVPFYFLIFWFLPNGLENKLLVSLRARTVEERQENVKFLLFSSVLLRKNHFNYNQTFKIQSLRTKSSIFWFVLTTNPLFCYKTT